MKTKVVLLAGLLVVGLVGALWGIEFRPAIDTPAIRQAVAAHEYAIAHPEERPVGKPIHFVKRIPVPDKPYTGFQLNWNFYDSLGRGDPSKSRAEVIKIKAEELKKGYITVDSTFTPIATGRLRLHIFGGVQAKNPGSSELAYTYEKIFIIKEK